MQLGRNRLVFRATAWASAVSRSALGRDIGSRSEVTSYHVYFVTDHFMLQSDHFVPLYSVYIICMLRGSTHYCTICTIAPRALSRHFGFAGVSPSDLHGSLSPTTPHCCTHVLVYIQHLVVPGGRPSNYGPSPALLNFSNRVATAELTPYRCTGLGLPSLRTGKLPVHTIKKQYVFVLII